MTSHRMKRCVHCQVNYRYQSSGHRCGRQLNDASYCPDCKAVINKALKDVPLRVKLSFEPTTEVTLEQLKAWEPEWQPGMVRRILPCLMDMENPENRHIYRPVAGQGGFQGKSYTYSYWTTAPDEVEICVATETDLRTVEQALKRPLDFASLSERQRWAIDKRLGILDWDPSPAETKEFVRRWEERTERTDP